MMPVCSREHGSAMPDLFRKKIIEKIRRLTFGKAVVITKNYYSTSSPLTFITVDLKSGDGT
jgi:hypothetical protein